MKLTSSAFGSGEAIPKKYTCQGEDVNPPLVFEDIPEHAQSLVLIVDDPDAPAGTWVHWVVYDIPVNAHVEENSVPGTQGENDFGRQDYGGPCPPSGTHRYFFKLYALDTDLHIPEGKNKGEIERLMQEHILGQAELIGTYSKQ
ncbi:MAG: YbhB/YbcL family Raf kinase inhibitor-like protein [Candidatus Omnitrophica bacterium]|nr:YbhB/YbcL family Raf kinase inhibitor-like protein [Candidatus Omnitrophota bacterium]